MILTELEQYLFKSGRWRRAYDVLGAHVCPEGVRFALWAPGAASVSAAGEWNGWETGRDELEPGPCGVWNGIVPEARAGMLYKFAIRTKTGEVLYKSDPLAFAAEPPPGTASRIVGASGYRWSDDDWIARRDGRGPMNVYELHAGSWRRHEDGTYFTWQELAETLPAYLREMHYTHAEFLPLTEHPFDGSWGYQATGFFAPTARYGSPDGLRRLVDALHGAGIGVILDWVPGHFCRNGNGLGRFCGEKLYEAADHLQWGTYKFDFSRPEVRSFLLSSGLYWLREFHADGLRLDGVTSMLSLNFGTGREETRRNASGGDEDTDAAELLRQLNTAVHEEFPGAVTAAEESTSRRDVTLPVEDGGLGFDCKWNMGWMNDTLEYFSTPFGRRPEKAQLLTFPLTYAFDQRYLLPLSHDEVVHGKKTLLGRMPGRYEEQFAGLRQLMLWQMFSPGKKLAFMGSEFAPYLEWREGEALEWFMLRYDTHREHRAFIAALNVLYLEHPALWADDRGWENFSWLDCTGAVPGVFAVLRRDDTEELAAVFNFMDLAAPGYLLRIPRGDWRQVFATSAEAFPSALRTRKSPDGSRWLPLDLPPLSAVVYRHQRRKSKSRSQE